MITLLWSAHGIISLVLAFGTCVHFICMTQPTEMSQKGVQIKF